MTTDPLKLYLKDLKKTRLLSKEEERELFSAIERGDQNARDLMWKCNTRLVVSIAKRYKNCGIEFIDLIAIGNVALFHAIDNFNLQKNCKFSTQATPHIKWAIKEALKNASGFKLTNEDRDNLPQFCAIKAEFTKQNEGKTPPLDQIAQEMGISYDEAIKIQELQNYSNSYSMNTPLKSDDEESKNSIEIADPKVQNYIKNMNLDDLSSCFTEERALKVFDVLTKQQREVMELRYGLIEGKNHTLQEIADKFGVSKTSISKTEKTSIKKIRQAIQNYETNKEV